MPTGAQRMTKGEDSFLNIRKMKVSGRRQTLGMNPFK
uniref:Uncharacterized protein n=1 Tax=Anguilla anguilla TaxID=7936 RepID=A0A0E9WPE6_ANGAN